MAITYPLSFPVATKVIQSIELRAINAVAYSRSPFTFSGQAFAYPGQMWTADISLKPMKRAGGRRFYRPADVVILAGVRSLLHDEGYTIKGLQKLHREQGLKVLVAAGSGERIAAPAQIAAPIEARGDVAALLAALHSLETAKGRLDGLLNR